MPERIDTVVLGAGQAGLSASHLLTSHGHEHVVLERGSVGNTWRTERWDGFFLNTPNFTLRLPGDEYDGPEPDAFLSLEETIAYLDGYAAAIGAPVRTHAHVSRVSTMSEGFTVEVGGEQIHANSVIVATGAYQSPTPTPLAAAVPADLLQLHTSAYRRPDQLPDGAVLIVGSGQSGCQIADELVSAGRDVLMCVGRCPWAPRRYRGREILHWLVEIGFMDQTVDSLPSPAARLVCNPPISGNDGGHDCHPLWLRARGVTLLGRLQDIRGHAAVLEPGLTANLTNGRGALAELAAGIDGYIAASGIEAPEADPPVEIPVLDEPETLDLVEAGIGTILWASGFRPDFGWIDVPLFDPDGWPVQQRGVTEYPGLYFLGLHWLHKRKSSLFLGVGEDAEQVVGHLVGRG